MGKTKETKIKSKTKSESKTNPEVKTKTANRKNLEVNVKSEVKSEVKSKSLTSVKNSSIVKHSQTPKAKSKKIAREVITKLKSKPELKQKSKKPPAKAPSPSSDDKSSSSEDDSESSESSPESPVKHQKIVTPSKPQIESAKKDNRPKDEDSDSSESDSSDSSDSADDSSDSDESSSEDGENGQPKNDSDNDSSNDSSDDSNESDSTSPETNNHPKINSKKPKDKQKGTFSPGSNGTAVSKVKPTSNGASNTEDKTVKIPNENESDSDENESDSGSTESNSDTNESDSDANESDSDANESDSDANKSDSDANKSESDSDSSSNESEPEVDRSSKKRKAETEPSPVVKRAKSVSNEGAKNLFVGNLSWNVDDEWLLREFEEFGEITRASVLTDKATGRSKGFGYVEFSNPESAKAALEAKKGSLIDGREVNVDFSTPRDENTRERTKGRAQQFGDTVSSPSDTLFCGNLSFGANEDTIGEAFGVHGTVVNVRLPTDMESGNLKGFGYVTFASIDEAKTAYEAMLGAEIDGRVVRLDYATPRPDRGAGLGSRGGRGRGDGRGRGGSRGGTRGGARGGRGGSTNRGGFGDFKGQKKTF